MFVSQTEGNQNARAFGSLQLHDLFLLIFNKKLKLGSKVTGTANNKLGDVRSASLLTLSPRYSP
jgi:hypothetical protein